MSDMFFDEFHNFVYDETHIIYLRKKKEEKTFKCMHLSNECKNIFTQKLQL